MPTASASSGDDALAMAGTRKAAEQGCAGAAQPEAWSAPGAALPDQRWRRSRNRLLPWIFLACFLIPPPPWRSGGGCSTGVVRPGSRHRQAHQRVKHFLALAVFADVAAALAVLGAVEIQHLAAEFLQHRLAALLPVLALEQHHEIIAADVADKIAGRDRNGW
jgi:hypothetical protein